MLASFMGGGFIFLREHQRLEMNAGFLNGILRFYESFIRTLIRLCRELFLLFTTQFQRDRKRVESV